MRVRGTPKVNPGLVGTEGTAGFPGDIDSVAVFLAPDDAGWLTGERLFASGGY